MRNIKSLTFEEYKTIKKTKVMLINALVDLMGKKSIDDLTITEIADHAQVGRRTFYRHFQKKEEILIEYIKILLDEFIRGVQENGIKDSDEIIREFFRYWYEHKDFINRLRDNRVCYLLILVGEQLVDDEEFIRKAEGYLNGREHCKLKITFLVAGTFRVLQRWIYDDMRYTPDEISKVVAELVSL